MIEINHTLIIIFITSVVSFVCFSNKVLLNHLIFWPPAIKQGQFYRFLTHGFIHANTNHLLFNMFTLFFFGSVIESFYQKLLGQWGFVVFYLLAIAVAILPSYLRNINNTTYASLGASGAVSAVLFAYVLFAPWNMLYFFGVVPIPAIVFAIGYTAYSLYAQKRNNDNINHSAHLWGAAFGALATLAIKPDLAATFINQLVSPNF